MTDKQAAAKEWLNRNFQELEEIRALELKLSTMRENVGNLTAQASEVKVQKQPNPHAVENSIISLVAFSETIENKKARLFASEQITMNTILKLEGLTLEKTVLIYRYLCCLPWKEIAAKMNYTENYLHEIHMRALTAIADKIDYTQT